MTNINPELKEFLEYKASFYQNEQFILDDPIQIPKRFTLLHDIEIIGLLTAIISWGNRKSIIKSAEKLITIFQYEPYAFIMNFKKSPSEIKLINQFVYRTFNNVDLLSFILALKTIYKNTYSLEDVFVGQDTFSKINNFRNEFVKLFKQTRTLKHLPNVEKGSAAKRINMYLRWMVRSSYVDLGLWKTIKPSELLIPLDVHSGTVARYIKLLKRKQNDKKAVLELTDRLKMLDANDPIKYDFALFGIGAYEKDFFKQKNF
jgi:uncharacterized protein (TIGR02757 family)